MLHSPLTRKENKKFQPNYAMQENESPGDSTQAIFITSAFWKEKIKTITALSSYYIYHDFIFSIILSKIKLSKFNYIQLF